MTIKYNVYIYSFEDTEPLDIKGPFDYSKALKIQSGMDINLDHENYYTSVESVKDHVVKKGKKYMEGHSYSTYTGYKFSWIGDIEKARKMDESVASGLAMQSKAKILKVNL
jgi:hypothetical protein